MKSFAWPRVILRLIAEEASWSPMAEHEAEPLRMKEKSDSGIKPGVFC